MELQELMNEIKTKLEGKQAPQNVPPFNLQTQVNSIQKSVFWVVHNHYDLGHSLDPLITYAARADQPLDKFLEMFQNVMLEAYKHSQTHAK
ncbi:MAG TPA: hypothetical protein DCS93_32260 [Microscillaceae bacterium]|nr:hypothetical protein [Microscillaceae bacterium]